MPETIFDRSGMAPLEDEITGTADHEDYPDEIWRHPSSGGAVYIGSVFASACRDNLRRHGIRRPAGPTLCAAVPADPDARAWSENERFYPPRNTFCPQHWGALPRGCSPPVGIELG